MAAVHRGGNGEHQRPEIGGDPYFTGRGHRLYTRNGAEELLLDLAPRALWTVAEQLLGEGEVVWPAGIDESGMTTGPCLMTEKTVKGMVVHLGPTAEQWTGRPTGKTEQLRLPKTGPVWSTGQGTRGLYCTLPNSPAPPDNFPGAHAEAMYDTPWRLQIAAYIDDLPPAAGGLTLWPRSHQRIWDYWEAMHRETPPGDPNAPRMDARTTPPIPEIKADTPPVMTHGPVGSVVLWHANMLHMVGQNSSSDVIRQATIYAFAKTPESVPDELVLRDPSGELWRDWSEEVRMIEAVKLDRGSSRRSPGMRSGLRPQAAKFSLTHRRLRPVQPLLPTPHAPARSLPDLPRPSTWPVLAISGVLG